ncbi:MAG: DEAD/DEAH box helicase, partial [Cyclobacteriaceae bacterium]|nr:DEAD/DEAH box helicase [Cyclobacteriaceae bacterium]
GFALPLLSRLNLTERSPQVLVLAPTRELAIQVADSFSKYAQCLTGFSVTAIYGGQDYEVQFRQLRRGPQVVVGTPGRIIDHINRGTLKLNSIRTLVLDEADEMLNMGFLDDVKLILENTPPERQIALFSATLPQPIREIADQHLQEPAQITIRRKTATADNIRQRAVFVPPRAKIDVLTRFLETESTDGVIVFTRTREATMEVAEQLVQA